MRHHHTDVTHEGWVSGAPGCLTDHHRTSPQLYAIKTTFKLILILKKSEKQWMSAVAVPVGVGCDQTRQDVEQGSILPAKAETLLGLTWSQQLNNKF